MKKDVGDNPVLGSSVNTPATANDPAALHEAAGQALFRLGRLFSRQPQPDIGGVSRQRAGVELSRIVVSQAVEAITSEPGSAVTIGAVARWLDIDPSTASRLVGGAIRDGYLARTTAATDARLARLDLTARGRELATAARHYQRAVFDEITHDWSAEERQLFARLFIRFASGVREVRHRELPESR